MKATILLFPALLLCGALFLAAAADDAAAAYAKKSDCVECKSKADLK
jgi:hypothetical protein